MEQEETRYKIFKEMGERHMWNLISDDMKVVLC